MADPQLSILPADNNNLHTFSFQAIILYVLPGTLFSPSPVFLSPINRLYSLHFSLLVYFPFLFFFSDPRFSFSFFFSEVFETDEELGNIRAGGVMGFCISPLGTPARLLWSTSFFRHKLMIF